MAYMIAAAGAALDVDRIRGEIKDKLPEYMVPSRFITVKEFPMTTSGKLDRKALPAPVEEGVSAITVAPRNELESKIAAAFASVLGIPSVGVTDNFFALGGHSLTAARLLSQVKEISGRDVPLSALLRAASVESLAQLVSVDEDVS